MTTTTKILADGRTGVSVREPAQLIASLPPLLGFRPADSLVVLGLGGPDGGQVCPAVRLDLPAAEHEPDIVQALMEIFADSAVRAVNIVVVGRHPSQPPPTTPPHRRLVELLCAAFAVLGPKVQHATWASEIRAGAPWHCYLEKDCEGVLPDENSTVTAAVFAASGHVTFDSREELADQLAPDDEAAVRRRAELMNAAVDALDPSVTAERRRDHGLALVRSALGRVRRGDLSFSDKEVVDLALALSNTAVRDACLALATVPYASRQAERLWLELVRRTPAPERTEPAVLLTYSAYLRGEGALAGIAADNALEANPANVLAGLLSRCLRTAFPPDRLTALAETDHLGALCPPDTPRATS
ncbi:DUF4192 domain-containing protein [Amycolatopsis acidiphila]|uniref:DUF4192 domain-containing protein n=1 Tax=Amycolatopsis acidiphila TaxID=715473 RepID=UPI001643E8D2|nr:DUF4192 domain-containing protein [Amycolatopsis acidiphila]UIJ58308.1 DUF4192 domain-containing protein [Amycolatopsis acidiphila]GHG95692.1 hypothetical protein GCM10017788_74390 [Amycolatopsis acidiphila]